MSMFRKGLMAVAGLLAMFSTPAEAKTHAARVLPKLRTSYSGGGHHGGDTKTNRRSRGLSKPAQRAARGELTMCHRNGSIGKRIAETAAKRAVGPQHLFYTR